MSPDFHWHGYDWVIAAALAWLAWAYLRHRTRGLNTAHVVAFAAGWLALALALLSPLDALAKTRFWIHMLQHETLMLIAAPLLVIGNPLGAIARALPRRVARLGYRPLRYASPLAAWLLHAAALWTWHVPRLFVAGVDSEAVHAAQHACFIFTASLFWWTVLRRANGGVAVVCVLTTMIHMGLLGALLTFSPAPLYAGYTLQDQQLGGLIMWVPAGFLMLGAGLWTFHRWLAFKT